jgi:hypothetical protein
MIRIILILTVLAALVPTAMSNVSAPADAEIALFSGGSDSDGLSISGNGDTAKMELKATNDNGKSNRVSDFQLTANNVLSAEVGGKVTVLDNVDFTKAVTTDARNNQKAIGITSNGLIDFAGYNQGVYTLDVVVDDDRAYEAIIAIGDQTNQIVDKEITRVNSEYTTKIEFVFPPIDPKPPKCKEGEELVDGKCEPQFDSCGCPIGKDCPAVVCEVPIEPEPRPPCKPSGDLDVCYPWDDEPPIDDTCMGGPPGVDGCPPGPEPEPIVLPEEPPEEIIPLEEESPEEEELEDSDDSEGDSEGDEDSGSDDSEGSEDSGGSDNEGREELGGSEEETSE